MDKSTSLLEIKREIEEVQEQISSVSVKILIKKEENEELRKVITGTLQLLPYESVSVCVWLVMFLKWLNLLPWSYTCAVADLRVGLAEQGPPKNFS